MKIVFKSLAISGALLLAKGACANVPTGAENVKFLLPAATGWDPPELRTLTNEQPSEVEAQLKRYRDIGGKGDPAALLTLAVLNERGLGLTRNLPEAARLCREAAKAGFAPAQHQLGLYLSEGIGAGKALGEALQWFEKAAAQGYAPAEYLMGYCHLSGEGVETNFAKANEWFRKAADHDFPAALHNLAVSYARGRAVTTNLAEALRLFRRAADLGSHTSSAAVAALLFDEDTPESLKEAHRLARLAAEHGDTVGQRLLANMLSHGRGVTRDREGAARWLQRAAGRGDWDADAELGLMYIEGVGVGTNFATARYWLEPAAEAGNAKAQSHLGTLYLDGKGVPTNHARALELFRKSSAQGEKLGWYYLGWTHAQGLGVPKDPVQAYGYYRRSAELGWATGERMTGVCLLMGMGVKTNIAEGVQWLIKAVAHGESDSIKLLSEGAPVFLREPATQQAAINAFQTAARSGSAEAALFLGRQHVHGRLLPRNRAQALEWLTFAATNGAPAAAVVCCFVLFDSTLGPPEPNVAWKWAEYAAGLDDMQGIPLLASRYLAGLPSERNVEAGTNWLWRGVQLNQAPSMTFLARLLAEGTLIPQDRIASSALLKRAAELGHAPALATLAAQAFATPPAISMADGLRYMEMAAQREWAPSLAILSSLYQQGKYVPTDPVRAKEYLVRAAAMNHAAAQCNLGIAFLHGQYGETNASKAAELLKASAQQGYVPGQSAFGYLLSRGEGVQPDPVEAWKWCELAAAGGDKSAGTIMGILHQTMTPEQIAEAQRRARTFQRADSQQPAYMSVPRPLTGAQKL